MWYTNACNKNTNIHPIIIFVFVDDDYARGYPVNLLTAATIYDKMYRPASSAH